MAPSTRFVDVLSPASMASSTPQFVEEDHLLQEAIEVSSKARAPNVETYFGDEDSSSAAQADQPPKYRINIEDRINHIALRATTELPIIRDPRADTWIFIDPPQKQPEQDQDDYERYIKHYGVPFAMRKDTLVKYSPVLEKMFLPTAQHRITRRRGLVKELRNSPHIKYVIDLTPPTEGEEAVYLTTELCCSEGVRLWYQARDIWKVSKILVGGEEEYTSVKVKKGMSPPLPPNNRGWRGPGHKTSKLTSPSEEANSTRLELSSKPPDHNITCMSLEYTPLRHRSAIERVLSALQGFDPRLDSAPKVWTTFAVAKYLGVKHSELDSYIIRWLRAYPNSYFLEVLPEVSLQIADGLENYELARDAFAILVGEEALDNLLRARKATSSNSQSAYGRKKEDLPEVIFTRVEYASKAFLERITNEFADLIGNDMQWIDMLPQYRRLSLYQEEAVRYTISTLKTLLKDYVRGAIYKLLCVNYDSVPAADLQHPGGEDLVPRISRSDVWNKLSPNERILSSTFWHALTSFKLFDGRSNLDIKEGWNLRWDSTHMSQSEQSELQRSSYCEILKSSLVHLVQDLNNQLSRNTADIVSALPVRTKSGVPLALAAQIAASATPIASADSTPGAQRVPMEAAVRGTPNHGSADLPDQRSANQGAASQWPFGSPRQNFAHDLPNQPYRFPEVAPVTAVSATDQGQHDHFVSQCPAEVSSSRSVCNGWDEDKGPDEISRLGKSRFDGLEPLPFFENDIAHPSKCTQQSPYGPYKIIAPKPEGYGRNLVTFFDLDQFFREAHKYVVRFGLQKLQSSDHHQRKEPFELGIINTLVCLQDSEWKYLPLWAGGNDDGSGGVYVDQPDTADLGFSSPGPDIHTGTPATSIKSPSELDFDNFEIVSDHSSATSTVNTSMANHRGFSDHMRRNRVYAADSVDTSSHQSTALSDDFTMVTDDDDNEEELARRQLLEYQEQIELEEEAAAKGARGIDKGKERMIDENYADLFDDEEDDGGGDTDSAENGDFEDDEDCDMVLV